MKGKYERRRITRVKMRERERERISVVKTMDANFQTIVLSSDELKKGEILEERERVRAI